MSLLGIISFAGLGALFFKHGCDHIEEAKRPESVERGSAYMLGVVFILIGVSGFAVAALILFSN